MPIIYRRTALLGLSGLACTSLVPLPAPAQPRRDDWRARLERDLSAAVHPETGTQLRLLRFTMDEGSDAMSAVVEMTWHPGLRRRGFKGAGKTAEGSYDLLLSGITSAFSAVNRAGVRT